MNLSELRDEVKFRIFPGEDAEHKYDSRIDTRLNWSRKDLCRRVNMPELEDSFDIILSTGQREYVLPEFTLWLSSAKNVNQRRPLAPLTWGEDSSIDETEQGEPTHFFRYGNSIFLYPIPASAYSGNTLRFRRRIFLADMVLDEAETGLPSYCDEAIILGAIWRLHRDQNELEFSQAARSDYFNEVKSLVDFRKNEFMMFGGTTRPLHT